MDAIKVMTNVLINELTKEFDILISDLVITITTINQIKPKGKPQVRDSKIISN